MRALVLGGGGLVGHSLKPALARAGHQVLAPSHGELDALDPSALARAVDMFQPDRIFNLVAYTQVDRAEDEPEAAFPAQCRTAPGAGRGHGPQGTGHRAFQHRFRVRRQGQAAVSGSRSHGPGFGLCAQQAGRRDHAPGNRPGPDDHHPHGPGSSGRAR